MSDSRVASQLKDIEIEELTDLSMQDTVPLKSIALQFGLTVDQVVAQMRKRLKRNSYIRWKERRNLKSFRKQSRQKATKHRVHSTSF